MCSFGGRPLSQVFLGLRVSAVAVSTSGNVSFPQGHILTEMRPRKKELQLKKRTSKQTNEQTKKTQHQKYPERARFPLFLKCSRDCLLEDLACRCPSNEREKPKPFCLSSWDHFSSQIYDSLASWVAFNSVTHPASGIRLHRAGVGLTIHSSTFMT